MTNVKILNTVLIFKATRYVAGATLPSLNSSLTELEVIRNPKFGVNLSNVVFLIHVSS
ncbi:MAG: hypothetical protein V7K62_21550 [Nostoc sp.]